MSLSKEMGLDVPENHILLPPESKRRIWDRDFVLREIKCGVCQTVLCALLIEDKHEADLVWPFDVLCHPKSHQLVEKGTPQAVPVFCHGKAVQEWEAKKYLEKYTK